MPSLLVQESSLHLYELGSLSAYKFIRLNMIILSVVFKTQFFIIPKILHTSFINFCLYYKLLSNYRVLNSLVLYLLCNKLCAKFYALQSFQWNFWRKFCQSFFYFIIIIFFIYSIFFFFFFFWVCGVFVYRWMSSYLQRLALIGLAYIFHL